MPHWTIRTRDDNGKDEKIKVRASDAGEAIRIAELDISHVLVVAIDWGRWGEGGDGAAKLAPKNSILRRLAMFATMAYIGALFWAETGDKFPVGPMGSTIVFYALFIGAIIVGAVLYHKGKAAFERERADVAEVLERDEITAQWWHATWAKWSLFVIGIGLGVEMIGNLEEGALRVPYGLVLPLVVLWFVMYDPTDFE